MEILILLMMFYIIGFQFYLLKLVKSSKEVKTIEFKTEEKPHETKLTEEQKKKQEELRKNFDNLMNYDYSQALKSSKGE